MTQTAYLLDFRRGVVEPLPEPAPSSGQRAEKGGHRFAAAGTPQKPSKD